MNKIVREKLSSQKGVTLVEMLISLLIASVVLVTLMSILTVTLTNKGRIDIKNKLITESYVLTETVQAKLFEKQPHEVEVTIDNSDQKVIEFRRTREIVVDGNILSDPAFVDPNPDQLIYDKINGRLYYNATLLHDENITLIEGSDIEVLSIDGTCDFTTVLCSEGVVKITVVMTLNFGSEDVKSQTFVTTIII